MGTGSSFVDVSPKYVLSDEVEQIYKMSNNDEYVLVLYKNTNTVKLFKFTGEVIEKKLNMSPSCCSKTAAGGWLIGFKNGYICEFDSQLNVLMTFHTPGGIKAHDSSVTFVNENGDLNSKNCHMLSVCEKGICNLWTSEGILLHSFNLQSEVTAINSSEMFAFIADADSRMNIVNIDVLSLMSYKLPSKAVSIEILGDGFGCICALEDNHVAFCSSYDVVEKYFFHKQNKIQSVFPLFVEENTGLITYLVVDTKGIIDLHALEKNVTKICDGTSCFSYNKGFLIYVKEEKLCVFSLDELIIASTSAISNLDLDLPRSDISDLLLNRY